MQRSVWIGASILTLMAVGCPEPTFTEITTPGLPDEGQLQACIEVEPTRVDFGAVDISGDEGGVVERQVTVRNRCDAEGGGSLDLTGLELRSQWPGVFDATDLGEFFLAQGQETTFTVRFSPNTSEDFSGRVEIASSDPNDPTVSVRLEGSGIAPRIEVSPGTYDYGAPYIGCEQDQVYSITNTGNADLVVGDVELLTAASEEFHVDLDPLVNGQLPFTVSPFDITNDGPEVEIYLDYLPLDTFEDTAFLQFSSNDPFVPDKVVAADGSGTKFGDNLDVFEQPIRAATDILFTLDRSGSMGDEIENVANNFDVFVATLSGLDADFHAAVAVGDVGCVAGPDPYIDASFSESAAVDAFTTMADWPRVLVPYGSNEERGFMVAEAALSSKNIGAGGCNDEFYRDDAFLSIVHVSDEPDQSVNTWSYYVSLFQSLKADPEDVVINAVAGDYPTGCAGASAGTGYYEGTVATGGVFLSICSTDWARSLEDLAAESVSVNDTFTLTQNAVPQTIEVKIDGVRINVGWEYEVSTNSVVFDRDFIPAGGSQIEVYYERLPNCEG